MKWQVFAASFCLLLLCWAAMLWQGGGLVRHIAGQEDRLCELRGEYAMLEKLQQEHPDLEKYQMEVEREKERVTGLLPDDMLTAFFLHDIKSAADRAGMRLRELAPEEAEEEDGLSSLPVRANLTGDYFSFLRFLQSLQNGSRLVQVDSMDVAQKGETLECRLKFKIFAEKS